MALSNLFRPSDWTSGQRDIKGLFGTGLSPLSGDQLTKDIGSLRTEAGQGVLRRFPTQVAKQNPVEYLRMKAQEIAPYDPTYAQELMDKANALQERQSQQALSEKEMQVRTQEKQTAQTAQDDYRITQILDEVATEFQNVNPNDQASWTQARESWIQRYPKVEQYIKPIASQANWDQIQAQGGFKENVAPKGEFAVRNKTEKSVASLTFLADQARKAGKLSEADQLTAEALQLQKSLSGQQSGGMSVDSVLSKYDNDIKSLVAQTTTTQSPSTIALFSKIGQDIGEGVVLQSVKDAINQKIESVKSGKMEGYKMNESQMKEQQANYKSEEDLLTDGNNKINAAKALFQKEIRQGASALASKFLQGDVLAEAEIKRYIAGGEGQQLWNNIRESVGLAPEVQKKVVANLINAMIEGYNSNLSAYDQALKGNTYKKNYTKASMVDAKGFSVPEKKQQPQEQTGGKPPKIIAGKTYIWNGSAYVPKGK